MQPMQKISEKLLKTEKLSEEVVRMSAGRILNLIHTLTADKKNYIVVKNLPEFNFRFIIGFRHIFCRCRARQPVLGGESCRQFFICREKENTMNIKRAKQEIRDSIEAYLSKDEFGEYRIPAIRQRPILLMGPPGIGKTQIMEQIARECGIALVSYTITHHTRQSAVGLPFIVKKNYGEEEFSVTEYTMSEIISSVYDKMEKNRSERRHPVY